MPMVTFVDERVIPAARRACRLRNASFAVSSLLGGGGGCQALAY